MSCKYEIRGPARALRHELVDDAGHVVEGRPQDGGGRCIAITHSGVVGRDDMKPIRQTRNEVVELVRRGGKTVQQDDGRLRRVPGLAVEETEARNVGGLDVHKALFPHLGIYVGRTRVFSNAQSFSPLWPNR